jgi:hypothetical protein
VSLAVGAVAIADNESVSGTGAARAIYDATVSIAVNLGPLVLPTLGATLAPYRTERPVGQGDIDRMKIARLIVLRAHATTCTVIANLIPYLVENASIVPGSLHATVTTESVGVTPTPNDPGAAILPPASPVGIPLTGSGSLL